MIVGAIILESITLAAIYLLIALAWVIIYRATKVLNFATGEMLLLGALVFATLHVAWGVPVPLALLGAAAVNALVGMAAHDVLLRPLAGRPVFAQIIVTVGFATVLASAMSLIWGNQPRPLPPPFETSRIRIGDAVLTTLDLAIVGGALVVYLALLVFLQRSRPGRQMRAAAESPLLAAQSGINITRVFRLSWAIAGIAMAFGGIGFAYLALVTPSIVDLGLRGIAPALIAGLDDVRGAVIGALVIAVTENLAAYYFGGEVRNVVAFAAILVVLMIRPYGLFGSPEIRRV